MTRLLVRLTQCRLPVGNEAAFQAGVEDVLSRGGFDFRREYDLGGDCGRIDFYLPQTRIGVELKVQGSPSDVARQLLRYAGSEQIAALGLVTGRARLGALPRVIGGKPLHVAAVWRGLL